MKQSKKSSVACCLNALVFTFFLALVSTAAAQPLVPGEGPLSIDHANRLGIIVELSVGFVPEGNLPNQAERVAQRAAIDHVQTALLNRLQGKDIAGVYRFRYTPYISMYASDVVISALARMPGVAAIHLDRWNRLDLAESIPLIGANATGSNYGTNAAVAILDTGVDSQHIHLWSQVISEACYSTTEDNPTTEGFDFTSLCPDGAASATGAGAAAPCTDFTNCSHGTHVAGIAAGGNLTGGVYQGVALTARIIAIKVATKGNTFQACFPSAYPCLITRDSDVQKALEKVLDLHNNDSTFSYYHIAAVNMSFSSTTKYPSNCDSHSLKKPIDNLRSVGIASVASSGNSNWSDGMGSPACISTAISVGNTTKQDAVYITPPGTKGGSNSASFLTLLAPGTSIYSPSFPGGGYTYETGTSFAAPHVTGAFAQLKHKNPNATVTQMLNALISTGVPILDPRNNVTKPRIQVNAAVNALP